MWGDGGGGEEEVGGSKQFYIHVMINCEIDDDRFTSKNDFVVILDLSLIKLTMLNTVYVGGDHLQYQCADCLSLCLGCFYDGMNTVSVNVSTNGLITMPQSTLITT